MEVSGFRFRRVKSKGEASSSAEQRRPCDTVQMDAFCLVHAVVSTPSEALVVTAVPQLTPQPMSSQPTTLATSHPFTCALREADVDAVTTMLSQEPHLAHAYISKPQWDPAPFEWSALSEALSHIEVLSGRTEVIVKTLLAHGARVDARDSKAATPLHQAATRGNITALEALLKAPDAAAAVWCQTRGGWLPIHNASHNARQDACQLLCEKMLWEFDHPTDNSIVLGDNRWPSPKRCDTAMLKHVIKANSVDVDEFGAIADELGA